MHALCDAQTSRSQLEELERATALAEKDFARFRIEKAELSSRRSWNSATRTQVRRRFVRVRCASSCSADALRARRRRSTR
jgi:hypothetical protein